MSTAPRSSSDGLDGLNGAEGLDQPEPPLPPAGPQVIEPVPEVTALFLPDVESPTIAAQSAMQAFPFTPDPDHVRLIDDLEWGLF